MGSWTPGPGATGGNDTFAGDDTYDEISAGNGNDTVSGEGGQDDLRGEAGNDSLDGGDAGDGLDGGLGTDTLLGGLGNDVLLGGAGADTVDGGDGDDIIVGGRGLLVLSKGTVGSPPAPMWFWDILDVVGGTTNFLETEDGFGDVLTGGAGDDKLYVGVGDTVDGGDGNDTAYFTLSALGSGASLNFSNGTGATNLAALLGGSLSGVEFFSGIGTRFSDTITLGAGLFSVTFFAGDGDDSVNATSSRVDIFGGDGADALTGSGLNDQLYANDIANTDDGEIDTIVGGAGDDLVAVGMGDIADGGAGVDTLWVNMSLRGSGVVMDTSPAGSAQAALQAASGGTYASFARFQIRATTFDDVIIAGTEVTNVEGGGGNDTLRTTRAAGATLDGGAGDDILEGGTGGDILYTGSGANTVTANGGSDTILVGTNGAGSVGVNAIDGGAGFDNVISAASSIAPLDLFRAIMTNVENAQGGAGRDWFTFADASGFHSAAGADGADTLEGGGGAEQLSGDSGNDVLIGAGGDDTLSGGPGEDDITGGPGNDIINGGADNDHIRINSLAGEGADQIDGGDGFDYLYLTVAPADVALPATLSLAGQGSSGALPGGTSYQNIEFILISGGSGDDSLTAADTGGQIEGGEGSDTLLGGAGRDIIYGGPAYQGFDEQGNDVLHGAAGNDQLDGGGGNDVAHGDEGDDTLFGNNGNDELYGGIGNDALEGGFGADLLDGGEGNDTLTIRTSSQTAVGGAGNDLYIVINSTPTIIEGPGGGRDRLSANVSMILPLNVEEYEIASGVFGVTATGNAQNNTLLGNGVGNTLLGAGGDDVLDGGSGDDILNGGDGADAASYRSAPFGVTVDLSILGPQDTGGGDTDTLVSIESVIGSQGLDTLTGNSGANTLAGEDGDDTLAGGDGNDVLAGGAGDDTLSGEEGDDVLDGGADSDLLHGGSGVDTLLGGDGGDVLFGGEGIDDLSGELGDDVLNGEDGNDDIRGGDGNDMIQGGAGHDTIAGLNDHDIIRGDAGDDFLLGHAGDDVLNGGSGVDQLNGGIGDDILVADISPDEGILPGEVYDGGEGIDTLRVNATGAAAGAILSANFANARLASLLFPGNPIDRLEFAGDSNVSARFAFSPTIVSQLFTEISQVLHVTGSAADNYLTIVWTGTGGLPIPNAGSLSGAAFTFGDWERSTWDGEIEDFIRYKDIVQFIALETMTADVRLVGSDTMDEQIIGALGNDELRGGGGSDVIAGGAGIDTLYGGDGNDFLVAEVGDDHTLEMFDGGAGRDFLMANSDVVFNGSLTSIEGFAFGDAADASMTIAWDVVKHMPADIFVIGSDMANRINIHIDTPDAVDLSQWRFANLYWSDSQDVVAIVGSAGNDAITGTSHGDMLEGGLGNDALNGGSGTDTASYAGASSGVGVNLAIAVAQNTVGAGIDTLISIENLTGSAFADTLMGSVGENVLDGGLSDDVLSGGAGDDVLIDAAGSLGVANINAGTGNDAITLTGAFLSGTVNGSVGNDQATASGDISGLTFLSVEILNAGAGALTGTAAQFRSFQTIQRSPDDPTGRVTLVLSTGGVLNLTNKTPDRAATVTGSAGLDIVTGSVGDDVLDGAGGGDTLNGGDGDDTLTGGNGPDTLNGGNGNDIIDGGTGNDVIAGGAGDDVIADAGGNAVSIAAGTGDDVITIGTSLLSGSVNGGLGVDQVNASGNLRNVTFIGLEILNTGGTTITASAAQMEAFDTIRVSAATPDAGVTLRLSAAGTINLVGELGTRAVNFTGSTGDDVISTGGGADVITGGAGNDTIHGGAGNDTIYQVAGEGHDIVRGGGGSDTYMLLGTAEAETFRILTRAEAAAAGITGLDALTEIVITRNGTDNASVVAELDDIEEIIIDSFSPTTNNGNGVVDGVASEADTVIVIGDFTTTSLDYSTIRIAGSSGDDTIDISGLSSAHRVVFTSNGGDDAVIGQPRPQDVFEGMGQQGRTMLAGAIADDLAFRPDGLKALIGLRHSLRSEPVADVVREAGTLVPLLTGFGAEDDLMLAAQAGAHRTVLDVHEASTLASAGHRVIPAALSPDLSSQADPSANHDRWLVLADVASLVG